MYIHGIFTVILIAIICNYNYLYIYNIIYIYIIVRILYIQYTNTYPIATRFMHHSHPPLLVLLRIAATLVPERHAPVRVRQERRTGHAATREVMNHDDLCSPVRKMVNQKHS